MELTLHYRGPLKANGNSKHKHEIRRQFHTQLKEFWNQAPLSGVKEMLINKEYENPSLNILKTVSDFEFAPLVSSKIHMVTHLEIFLLRPEKPGSIIIQSGDIDNRLKTLLDSLKMPDLPNALPKGITPSEDEKPFFCLLEDDSLVTKVSVETDRLLLPKIEPTEAVINIRVTTKFQEKKVGTLFLP